MSSALTRMRERVCPVAASCADDVDREGRFPAETFAALKEEHLLASLIPTEFGGEGLSLMEVADLCSALAQVCASSALILAMHHIKVSTLVHHARGSAWHEDFMRRCARDQLLLGSVTTEGGLGGDIRNSLCAVERTGDRFRVEKAATVVSYGVQADALLVTARKDASSPSSDQVMVVGEREDMTLTWTGGWDTFGMRGTCSDGFHLVIEAPAEKIFPTAFSEITAQSMLAHVHLLWSAVWYGIAAEAAARAQALVRAELKRRTARGETNIAQPGALRLAELMTDLQAMRGNIVAGIQRFEAARQTPAELDSLGFGIDMLTLKVATSNAVLEIVNRAMLICGIHGYRNDTPYSLGRLLRDAHSAHIMINNDRVLTNTASLLLAHRPTGRLGY